MDSDHWKQVEELYQAALEREESGRTAFLEQACAGDGALRGQVESLLAHYAQASGSFLEESALEMAARALAMSTAVASQTGPATRACWPTAIGRYRILDLVGEGG